MSLSVPFRESARNSKGHEQPVVIERKEWKNGISLLELIQSKKRLVNSNVLIQPLFDVLKICLDQEEQTTFEYAKQLVLGCLLDCCKKLSTEKEDVNENNLNVELVVHCLRASPNPQTHHHALMLLSYLSAVIPVSSLAEQNRHFKWNTKFKVLFFTETSNPQCHGHIHFHGYVSGQDG